MGWCSLEEPGLYAWPMFCGQRSRRGQHPRRKEVVRQESREKQ